MTLHSMTCGVWMNYWLIWATPIRKLGRSISPAPMVKEA